MLAECRGQLSVGPGQRGLLSGVNVSDLQLYGPPASPVCRFPEKATEARVTTSQKRTESLSGKQAGKEDFRPKL